MVKGVIEGLKDHREAIGMEVKTLSRKAYVSEKTLWLMERQKPVGLPICERVAKVLRLGKGTIQISGV